ncbi:SRPBCC domain-containing protein [Marinobacterium sp. D7]|uniref:SRPBCC domain-containing protein n=1 Tax=Marinobacterium ramblicola TaxID=2849041 RepID=UPI001C2D68E2|nr:SRPBCC domain-containing protein [Marinobacterium ramblicola]MBV1788522.1 SRPBCC domain-containing protein [Marinobacterium ramblicola]
MCESKTLDDVYELSVTHYIDAPPDKVWRVLTERLQDWWCPKPWRTVVNAIDWRAGGVFDTKMIGPEGQEFDNAGVFLEVTPGKRFVFTDAFDGQWNPKPAFMIGLFEIAPEGVGTRYTASARHWKQEEMEKHKEMGFTDGWMAVACQVAELAEAAD